MRVFDALENDALRSAYRDPDATLSIAEFTAKRATAPPTRPARAEVLKCAAEILRNDPAKGQSGAFIEALDGMRTSLRGIAQRRMLNERIERRCAAASGVRWPVHRVCCPQRHDQRTR